MSENAAATPEPVAKKAGAAGQILSVLMVIVLVPLLSYAVIQYLVVPNLERSMKMILQEQAQPAFSLQSKAAAPASAPGKSGEFTHEFGAVTVNLSGGEGTRYLRADFVIASPDSRIAEIAKANEVALRDAAITVLSSQTLDTLEGADGRDSVRRALISQLNRALGSEIVNQVYFSEFVIQ